MASNWGHFPFYIGIWRISFIQCINGVLHTARWWCLRIWKKYLRFFSMAYPNGGSFLDDSFLFFDGKIFLPCGKLYLPHGKKIFPSNNKKLSSKKLPPFWTFFRDFSSKFRDTDFIENHAICNTPNCNASKVPN